MSRTVIFAALLILAGCGGGGGSSGGKSEPSVAAPSGLKAEFDNGTVTVSWSSSADSHHIYYGTDPDMTVSNYAAHGGTWIKNVSSPHEVKLDNPGPDHYFLVTALSGDRESPPARAGALITRFSAIGDVVIDHENGIEWQRCVVGQAWDGETCKGSPTRMDHIAAGAYVNADANGWRLPTYDQLHSLVYCSSGNPSRFKPSDPHHCRGSASPAIYPLFTDTPYFATYSRPIVNGQGYACGISFDDGRRSCVKPAPGLGMIVRLSRDIAK